MPRPTRKNPLVVVKAHITCQMDTKLRRLSRMTGRTVSDIIRAVIEKEIALDPDQVPE